MKYRDLHISVPSEHSCFGRCEYREPEPESCRCDPDCELFRDCCMDYFDACSARNTSGSLNTTMFTCDTLKDNPHTELTSVLLVAKCRPDWKESGIRERCEVYSHDFTDFLDEWPVFDHAGNNFRNIFCAICNGYDFRNSQPWDVSFSPLFDNREEQHFPESNKCENETKSILGKVGKQLRFCFPSMISRCPPSYNNESVSSACLAYSANVCPTTTVGQKFFKNPHCAACNGFLETFPPCPTSLELLGQSPFLKSIWTFKAAQSNGVENIEMCPESNQLFDPYSNQCRRVSCLHDSIPITQSQCNFQLEITSDINDMCCERQESWILFKTDDPTGLNLRNEILPCFLDVIDISQENFAVSWKMKQFMGRYFGHIMIEGSTSVCNMARNLDQIFTDHVEDLASCRINSIEYLYMGVNTAQGDSCDGIWFNGTGDDFQRINGTELGDVVIYDEEVIIPQHVLHEVSYIRDEEEQEFTKTEMAYICGEKTQLLTCPIVTLFRGDYDALRDDGNRIKLLTYNITLDKSEFVIFPDGRILICTDRLFNMFKTTASLFSYSGNLHLANTIGITVSLVSLTTLFLLRATYTEMRNFHGWCVMKLSGALFVAQFFPMISSQVHIPYGLCVAFAMLAHYAWLASFTWMTIIGMNLFHLLVIRPLTRPDERESTRLFRIVIPIVGWAFPSIPVAICICLHFMKVDSLFFEYGSSSPCWITNPMANLLSFGVPIGISLLINISLYLIIVFKSCGQQRRSRQLRQMTRSIVQLEDIVLCLKVSRIICSFFRMVHSKPIKPICFKPTYYYCFSVSM